MRLSIFLLIFASATTFASTFHGHAGETWHGQQNEDGIHVFRGIPFAAPPVGDYRWQPPRPYQPSTGNKSARQFAPACMRADRIEDWYRDLIERLEANPNDFEGPNGSSEDCLYLNVWTPTLDRKAKLPVMIWIHGGSNVSGWSYEPDYRGNQLAQQDVVVISVGYRLGAFAMFALPELIEEQGGTAGNYGLLDIIEALKFVRQHASAFGGDPNNVTLFGESAGAENIAALMASPTASPLFHKAIHQSGPAMSAYQLKDIVQYSQSLAQGRTLAEMRAMAADDVFALQNETTPELGFGPFAGGHILPAGFLYEAVQSKPLMIGTNDHEWLLYMPDDHSLKNTIDQLKLDSTEDELRAKLPGLTDAAVSDRLVTANNMYCPSIKLADIVANEQPAFFYLFARIRDGEYGQRVGAYHGAEIPYVFDHHDQYLVTVEADRALTQVMMGYWVNFARSGSPNGDDLPDWPLYDKKSKTVLTLNINSEAGPARDLWMCR